MGKASSSRPLGEHERQLWTVSISLRVPQSCGGEGVCPPLNFPSLFAFCSNVGEFHMTDGILEERKNSTFNTTELTEKRPSIHTPSIESTGMHACSVLRDITQFQSTTLLICHPCPTTSALLVRHIALDIKLPWGFPPQSGQNDQKRALCSPSSLARRNRPHSGDGSVGRLSASGLSWRALEQLRPTILNGRVVHAGPTYKANPGPPWIVCTGAFERDPTAMHVP